MTTDGWPWRWRSAPKRLDGHRAARRVRRRRLHGGPDEPPRRERGGHRGRSAFGQPVGRRLDEDDFELHPEPGRRSRHRADLGVRGKGRVRRARRLVVAGVGVDVAGLRAPTTRRARGGRGRPGRKRSGTPRGRRLEDGERLPRRPRPDRAIRRPERRGRAALRRGARALRASGRPCQRAGLPGGHGRRDRAERSNAGDAPARRCASTLRRRCDSRGARLRGLLRGDFRGPRRGSGRGGDGGAPRSWRVEPHGRCRSPRSPRASPPHRRRSAAVADCPQHVPCRHRWGSGEARPG